LHEFRLSGIDGFKFAASRLTILGGIAYCERTKLPRCGPSVRRTGSSC